MADGTLIVTNAGLAAVIAANKSGTNKITISRAGLGSGKYTPAANRTDLYSQFKTISTINGGGVDDYTLHVEIRDTSSDAYTVYELGLFLSDGTLFAVGSSTSPILQKSARSTGVIVCDIRLADDSVRNITFGDTNFTINQSTETTSGVSEIATTSETASGVDDTRIVTPKKLKGETDKCVKLTGSQTVAGVKTFSSSPKAPTPASAENSTVVPTTAWVKNLIAATLLAAHPVGSYYITEGTEKPADLFGGTWVQVKDRFLIGAGNTYAVKKEGGESSVTLSETNIPAHTHTASTASSGGHTHTATTSSNGGHTHTVTAAKNGDHVHGHVGESDDDKFKDRPFNGFYDTTKSYWGFDSEDKDNALWNTTKNGAHTHTMTVSTNGAHTHTLTTSSSGGHTHTITVGSTGSGKAFSILNPYRAVYMWRRTA